MSVLPPLEIELGKAIAIFVATFINVLLAIVGVVFGKTEVKGFADSMGNTLGIGMKSSQAIMAGALIVIAFVSIQMISDSALYISETDTMLDENEDLERKKLSTIKLFYMVIGLILAIYWLVGSSTLVCKIRFGKAEQSFGQSLGSMFGSHKKRRR
jgi:NADH:ubiquinone oxidoreductase subunit 5 (subunit L)/multisubunit Na+/H+ antiporter MnhA subunit